MEQRKKGMQEEHDVKKMGANELSDEEMGGVTGGAQTAYHPTTLYDMNDNGGHYFHNGGYIYTYKVVFPDGHERYCSDINLANKWLADGHD